MHDTPQLLLVKSGKTGNVALPQQKFSPGAGIITGMKMLTEYLERALSLERLAADEQDATFKSALLRQAEAYRKLATKRAAEYGLPAPSPPKSR